MKKYLTLLSLILFCKSTNILSNTFDNQSECVLTPSVRLNLKDTSFTLPARFSLDKSSTSSCKENLVGGEDKLLSLDSEAYKIVHKLYPFLTQVEDSMALTGQKLSFDFVKLIDIKAQYEKIIAPLQNKLQKGQTGVYSLKPFGRILYDKDSAFLIDESDNKPLGTGAYNIVRLALNLKSGELVAARMSKNALSHSEASKLEKINKDLKELENNKNRVVIPFFVGKELKETMVRRRPMKGVQLIEFIPLFQQDLEKYAKNEKFKELDDAQKAKIYMQMSEALAILAKGKLRHNDVKESNYMIDHLGDTHLIDFETINSIDADGDSKTTIVYISPEFVRNMATLEEKRGYFFNFCLGLDNKKLESLKLKQGISTLNDKRDAYSLGVALYRMHKGVFPPWHYKGNDRNEGNLKSNSELITTLVNDMNDTKSWHATFGTDRDLINAHKDFDKYQKDSIDAVIYDLLHPDPVYRISSAVAQKRFYDISQNSKVENSNYKKYVKSKKASELADLKARDIVLTAQISDGLKSGILIPEKSDKKGSLNTVQIYEVNFYQVNSNHFLKELISSKGGDDIEEDLEFYMDHTFVAINNLNETIIQKLPKDLQRVIKKNSKKVFPYLRLRDIFSEMDGGIEKNLSLLDKIPLFLDKDPQDTSASIRPNVGKAIEIGRFYAKQGNDNMRELLARDLHRELGLDQYLVHKEKIDKEDDEDTWILSVDHKGQTLYNTEGMNDYLTAKRERYYAEALKHRFGHGPKQVDLIKRKDANLEKNKEKVFGQLGSFKRQHLDHSIQTNLLNDLLFSSTDSHPAQFIMNDRVENIDMARLLPIAPFVKNNNGQVRIMFRSTLLDLPAAEQEIDGKLKNKILSLNVTQLKDKFKSNIGEEKDFDDIRALLRKRQRILLEKAALNPNLPNDKIKIAYLNDLHDKDILPKIRKEHLKVLGKIHPKAFEKFEDRIRKTQQFFSDNKNSPHTAKKLFAFLYPQVNLFYEILERIEQRPGDFMGTQLNQEKRRIGPRYLSDIIEEARAKKVVSVAEIKKLELVRKRLIKEKNSTSVMDLTEQLLGEGL